MLDLSNVTLLCVETREPELAYWAIDRCLRGTQFAKIVLITNLDRVNEKRVDIDYVQAPPIKTTKDYSELLLTGIGQYVNTSHVLIIQWDSFILHPEFWSDVFLQYDYIGPVWPHHPETPVGNGGFSLRSAKLLEAIKHPEFLKKHPEDYCICADNREFLEQKCGIKFAPFNIAEQFAVERSDWHEAFGFHGFFNFGNVLDDKNLLAFLEMLPDSYLRGVDAYDLVDYLLLSKRLNMAAIIGSRIQFTWKLRKRFFLMKIRIIKCTKFC